LLAIEAGIDGCAVGAVQVGFGHAAGAANAFGDVIAGQLKMHAAEDGAVFGEHGKSFFQFRQDFVEAPGLEAVGGHLGVFVHGIATPEHGFVRALHGLDDRR